MKAIVILSILLLSTSVFSADLSSTTDVRYRVKCVRSIDSYNVNESINALQTKINFVIDRARNKGTLVKVSGPSSDGSSYICVTLTLNIKP